MPPRWWRPFHCSRECIFIPLLRFLMCRVATLIVHRRTLFCLVGGVPTYRWASLIGWIGGRYNLLTDWFHESFHVLLGLLGEGRVKREENPSSFRYWRLNLNTNLSSWWSMVTEGKKATYWHWGSGATVGQKKGMNEHERRKHRKLGRVNGGTKDCRLGWDEMRREEMVVHRML